MTAFERKNPSTLWIGMRYFADISSMSAIWYGARISLLVITRDISRISIFSGQACLNPSTIPYSRVFLTGISTMHPGIISFSNPSGMLYVRGCMPIECSDGMMSRNMAWVYRKRLKNRPESRLFFRVQEFFWVLLPFLHLHSLWHLPFPLLYRYPWVVPIRSEPW